MESVSASDIITIALSLLGLVGGTLTVIKYFQDSSKGDKKIATDDRDREHAQTVSLLKLESELKIEITRLSTEMSSLIEYNQARSENLKAQIQSTTGRMESLFTQFGDLQERISGLITIVEGLSHDLQSIRDKQ